MSLNFITTMVSIVFVSGSSLSALQTTKSKGEHSAPLESPKSKVAIEIVSQKMELEPSTQERFGKKPVFVRRVRFRIHNNTARSALLIRSLKAVPIALDASKYSQSLRTPKMSGNDRSCTMQEISPMNSAVFECAYPHAMPFQTEFAIALDRPQRESAEWINIMAKDDPSIDDIKWVINRTQPIKVDVPAPKIELALAPEVTVVSSKDVPAEYVHETGQVQEWKERRVTFRVTNRALTPILFLRGEPTAINFYVFTQSLSWPIMRSYRRLPEIIDTAEIYPGKSITFTCKYPVGHEFSTDFGFLVLPGSDDLKIWRALKRTTGYGEIFNWIQERLSVVLVDIG